MPAYNVTAPDGTKYRVSAPDGVSEKEVLAHIQQEHAKSAPTEQPSTIGDVAKSFGRGIAKGAMNLAGMPGYVANLEEQGIKILGRKIGLPEPPAPSEDASLLHRVATGLEPPTSRQIQEGVEGVTGKLGEPETTAGKYAQSVGEFVPSAVIGPGGLATKAATTLAGGLGAEAGGELAGTPGRLVGGLLGGAGAGLAAAETQAGRLSAKLPSAEEIKKASQQAYDMVANAKLKATQGAIDRFTSDIRTALDDDLIVDTVAPRTFKAIEKLQDAGGDIGQIMGVREKLGKITPSDGTEYAAASHVRDAIDTFIDNLPPHEVLTGDPKFTQAMLDHARSNWRAYRKLEQVEKAAETGEHRAAASGAGANAQNAMRQRVREILDSDKKSRGFSDETKKKMEEIVMGTTATNTARLAGKFAPSGPVSATTSILAGMEAGVPVGAAVGVGATLARHLGTYLTRRQIRELADMIRGESPLGRPTAAANAAQAPNFHAILPAAAARSSLATHSQDQSLDDLLR